jgi:hypothetical protein
VSGEFLVCSLQVFSLTKKQKTHHQKLQYLYTATGILKSAKKDKHKQQQNTIANHRQNRYLTIRKLLTILLILRYFY